MTISGIAALVGSVIVLGMGIVGLIVPRVIARSVDLVAASSLGVAELRAVFGGAFITLGLACLMLKHPAVYLTVSLVFFSAASIKLVSCCAGGLRLKQVLPGMSIDLLIAVLLLVAYQ